MSGATVSNQSYLSSKASADYDRLRDWYLARLRKQFVRQQSSTEFTPSALIAADKDLIEKLLVQSKELREPERGELLAGAGPSLLLWAATWLSGQVLLATLFCFAISNARTIDSITFDRLLLTGALFELGYSICTFLIFKIKVVDILTALQRRIDQGGMIKYDSESAPGNELALLSRSVFHLAQQLKRVEKQQNAIADYSQQIICSFEVDGTFRAASPSSRQLLGYSSLELIGTKLFSYTPSQFLEEVGNLFSRTHESKKENCAEIGFISRSGEFLDLRATLEWSESQGCFFCLIDNITVEKRVERLKQEFLSMITHDLRTPLTAVHGTCGLLLSGALGAIPADIKPKIDVIAGSSQRMLALVNELLDIERLSEGKMPLEVGETDVQDMLERIRIAMQPLCEPRNLSLTIDAADFKIIADRDRLTQVLVNLISNAIKFSPDGGTIQVLAHCQPRYALFTIRDQGRGIPSDECEKVFDRYRQVELSDAKLKGGSGLGLAICKAIVEAHQGTIGVESKVGEGSKFWFQIPLVSISQ